MPELSNAQVIKEFFGKGLNGREVTFKEIKDFLKGDKEGYNEIAAACRKELTK